jgi:hypothetical protein
MVLRVSSPRIHGAIVNFEGVVEGELFGSES